MSEFYVLGVDPGFANVGFALCHCGVAGAGERMIFPVKAGVIRTEKSDKKLQVLASNDNTRRMREIAKALDALFREINPQEVRALCVESMSFPRNAGTAAKMAMSWGVLTALAHVRQVAIFQASPQQIKLKLCGKKSASKEDIQAAVDRMFGAKLNGNIVDGYGQPLKSKADLAHPYDALAAVVTCMESEALQFLWK